MSTRARPVRTSRRVNTALLAFNLAIAGWNFASGNLIGLMSLAVAAALLAAVTLQTKRIRTIAWEDRPRPDYGRIARMEREFYGSAFHHDGAPVAEGSQSLARVDHRRPASTIPSTGDRCRMCEDRHQVQQLRRLARWVDQ